MDMMQGMALMDYIGAYFNYFMEIVSRFINLFKGLA